MSEVEVLSVASELFPLVKTGGLADVAGALPGALAAEGVFVRSLIPGYPSVLDALIERQSAYTFSNLLGGPAEIVSGRAQGLDLFVLDAPHLFQRPGNPYLGPDGLDWPDNALRFAALARAAASVGQGRIPGYIPDIVHCHDWQAGLVPAYLLFDGEPRPRTIITIHNLAFQGRFPATLLSQLGLPPRALAIDGVEYFGGIGFLKAGLQLADHITTVSPTYAAEIRTPEGGMGLDGLLRARSDVVSGILNGIDTAIWNPAADHHLTVRFDARRLAARSKNKAALRARMRLSDDADSLLFGVITRLSGQKGLDLLLAVLHTVLEQGAQVALLGSGDTALEDAFQAAALANPGRIGVVMGYDESLAHMIQGGADSILVPSRFEPCGLTQLCALRYGAVPLVSRVGGLADTVIDANEAALSANVATGLHFAPVTVQMLDVAIRRAAALHRDPIVWKRLQLNGMRTDVSWRNPARRYAALYRRMLASTRASAQRLPELNSL